MNEDMSKAIIPVTIISDEDYNPEDNYQRTINGDLNGLFVFPYNINSIYNYKDYVIDNEDSDDFIALKYLLQSDVDSYAYMEIYDAIMGIFYEFYNDIFTSKNNPRQVYVDMFLEMLKEINLDDLISYSNDISTSDSDVTNSIVFSKVTALFSNYISKMTLQLITHDERDILEAFYNATIVINEENQFDNLYNNLGNRLYVIMSCLFRDHIEVKLSMFRKLLHYISTNISNMKKYSILNQQKQSQDNDNNLVYNPYYHYLTHEKYHTEGE